MSNYLAIAAVTATLHDLIFLGVRDELGSGNITAKPLDKARENRDRNQVNLFLYHTMPNVAWQNRHRPGYGRHSETDKPPFALDLYYLVTAYGENDSEVKSHRLLGQVMSVLYDHTTLNAVEIEAATATELAESDLHKQVEQITIAPQSLSFDEMSQLWRGFQAQYRPSVAYKVSVVMIDSTLPVRSAPLVLSRGHDERGADVFYGAAPSLREIQLPYRKPSAELGNTVTLRGELFDSPDLRLRFHHQRLGNAIEMTPPSERTTTRLEITLPDPVTEPGAIAQWPAGFYSLSLVVQREDYAWTTNELPFTLAPQIRSITPLEAPPGNLVLTVTCIPQVRVNQRVVLLFGDRGIFAQDISVPTAPTEPTTLTFRVQDADPGIYVLRLRVDGVDSIPIDFTTRPLQFAASQQVRIVGA